MIEPFSSISRQRRMRELALNSLIFQWRSPLVRNTVRGGKQASGPTAESSPGVCLEAGTGLPKSGSHPARPAAVYGGTFLLWLSFHQGIGHRSVPDELGPRPEEAWSACVSWKANNIFSARSCHAALPAHVEYNRTSHLSAIMIGGGLRMSVSNAESATPLQRSVDLLEERVQAIENRLDPVAAVGTPSDLSGLMADVVRITQELFPGAVSLDVIDDPEYPQDRFTVIEAQASGPVEDVVQRQAEWHRRVLRLSPSCSALRLTFDYRE
jgi:hypothetical protein